LNKISSRTFIDIKKFVIACSDMKVSYGIFHIWHRDDDYDQMDEDDDEEVADAEEAPEADEAEVLEESEGSPTAEDKLKVPCCAKSAIH
jgi:hypothetical protein